MSYEHDLSQGACTDLHPAVADKYFTANRNTDLFSFLTAKAICGHCVVQAECIVDAITHESPVGVRGGESTISLERMRAQYVRGVPASELVARAPPKQKYRGDARTSQRLRQARFADAVPIRGYA